MLKPLVPNFSPDLSARLKDIPEKQDLGKLKPIVGIGAYHTTKMYSELCNARSERLESAVRELHSEQGWND